MRTNTWTSLLGLLIALIVPCATTAQIEGQTQGGGAPHVSGGAGTEERKAMDTMENYNLKMTMALNNGHLVGDVKVVARDSSGQTVLDTVGGPVVAVQLKPGTYSISATYEGQERKQSVTIAGTKKQEVTFNWSGPE